MLKGKTRVIQTSTTVGGKIYDRFLIHIPSQIATDSQFPWSPDQAFKIDIHLNPAEVVLTPISDAQAKKMIG